MTGVDRLVQLAGAALVGLVLADVFFTVLFPASGSGPIRRPLSRWVWRSFRLLGRRLRPPRRHRLLAYSGPVQITVTIAVGVLLVTAGWAMIFQPALGTAVVAADGSTDTGWRRRCTSVASRSPRSAPATSSRSPRPTGC